MSEFESLMGRLGVHHSHPDADENGVTRVTPERRRGHQPGAGFSVLELALHTDRSSLAYPPRFLGMYFERLPAVSGVPAFADLRLLSDDFTREELDRLTIVSWEGQSRPLLLDGTSLRYRFRDDAWWRLSGPKDLVADVRQKIDEVCFQDKTLTSGDGYVLDNHRVAHGRSAIVDRDRVALRVLIDEAPS